MNIDNLSDSDMREYILYVIPNDANSEKAQTMISHEIVDNVWVQDIMALTPPLPNWLTGVPTLVHKPSKQIMKGTQCISFLSELQETAIKSYSGFSSQFNCQSSFTNADSGNSMGLYCQDVTFDKPSIMSARHDEDVVNSDRLQQYKCHRMHPSTSSR